MGVLLYTLVMVLGISDEDLLMNRMSMKLPLIDLGLKPLAWFIVVPVMLLILHGHLLHNLDEHLAKLKRWQVLNSGRADPRDLKPFFLDFAYARRGQSRIGGLLEWMVWLMAYQLPLWVFLVLQVRFGAYQNVLVSVLHFILTAVDFALFCFFYRRWSQAPILPHSQWSRVFAGLFPVVMIAAIAMDLFSSLPTPAWLVPAVFFLLTLRLARLQRSLCALQTLLLGMLSLLLTLWFCSAWQVASTATFISKVQNPNLDALLPRLQVRDRILVNIDENEKNALQMLAYHELSAPNPKAYETKANAAKPNPAASLTDLANYKIAEQWWQQGQRQNWRKRSLNYANLSDSVMVRAELADASLQGAVLMRAQLKSAFLFKAQLQSANLWDAQLQGAALSGAQLQGAILSGAQLQGADLWGAQLQYAALSGAQLQGADLSNAQLQGAYLQEAQLQIANLAKAQLQGANCQIEGSYIIGKERIKYALAHHASLDSCQAEQFSSVPARQIESLLTQIPFEGQAAKDAMRKRLEHPANLQQAFCGELTLEMVDKIGQYWHSRVPKDITDQWAKKSPPCNPATLTGAQAQP